MATIYNKTALKKVKKDELVQMFLDQQAKLNDSHLAKDVADHCNNLYDRIRKLKAENEKLKEEIKEPKELFMYKAKVKELREDLIKEKEEHEKVKSENGDFEHFMNILQDWMMSPGDVWQEFIKHILYADYTEQIDEWTYETRTRYIVNKYFKVDDKYITTFDLTKEEKNKHLNTLWKEVKEELIRNDEYRPDKLPISDDYEWIK